MKKGEITYGYHNVKEFLQPDGTIKVFGNIGWFTNLPKEKCIRKLSLMHHYYEADGMTQKMMQTIQDMKIILQLM